MKKAITLLIALTMCIGVCSCGGGNDDSSSSTTVVTTITKAEPTTTSKTKDNDTTTTKESSSSSSSSSLKSISDSSSNDGYYCMGKNDTCTNKTSSPYDLYCHSCDPDDNNIEGDQSSKSYGNGGSIKDNDYDNDIDEEDWEKAWGDYLDDKYGY